MFKTPGEFLYAKLRNAYHLGYKSGILATLRVLMTKHHYVVISVVSYWVLMSKLQSITNLKSCKRLWNSLRQCDVGNPGGTLIWNCRILVLHTNQGFWSHLECWWGNVAIFSYQSILQCSLEKIIINKTLSFNFCFQAWFLLISILLESSLQVRVGSFLE